MSCTMSVTVGLYKQKIGAEFCDFVTDLRPGPLAYGDHADDGTHAEYDTQRCERTAQPIGAKCANGERRVLQQQRNRCVPLYLVVPALSWSRCAKSVVP